MVLDILAFLVIIVPAALIHYRAGLWAAVLSLWGALVAGAVAFGFYLPLSALVFKGGPDTAPYYWGQGVTLLGLFVVAFGVMRLVSERFLRNAMTFNLKIDTIAGPVVGALGGYVLAGILVVFAQMMPLSPKVMGYEPFSVGDKTPVRMAHLIGRYDDVILGIYNGLSGGALAAGQDNLASHYPAAEPLKASAGKQTFRGETADDILYALFRRRVAFSLLKNPAAHYAGKGVSLGKVGETGTFSAGRGQASMEIKIEDVQMQPALVWTDPSGTRVIVGPDDIAWEPAPEEGSRKKAASHAGESLLVVTVSFRPKKDEAQNVLLKDWELDSVFKDKKSTWSTRNVKLLMEATTKGSAITPVALEKLKKDELSLMDLETVASSIELPAPGDRNWNGEGKTMILAGDANWGFVDNSRWSKAVLVYAVPSMSTPWQYGLKCAPEDVADSGDSKKVKTEGLSRGRKIELPSLKIEVLEAGLLSRLNSRLTYQPAEGNQLMQVRLKITPAGGRDGPKQVLLTSKDLQVTNTVTKTDYVTLLHEMLTMKDEAIVSDIEFRKADTHATTVETVDPDGDQAGERLGKDWQIFFEATSGSVECRLVFEAPRGKPLYQYDLKEASQPTDQAPDWYLMKNAEQFGGRTHNVVVLEAPVVESIPLLSSRGRPLEYRAAAGGGQELVVVKLSFQPKKDDDHNFYKFDPRGTEMQLSRKVSSEPLQVFAVRAPGAENFVFARRAEEVTLHDITVMEFAFTAPKDREGAKIAVPGGRAVSLDTGKESDDDDGGE
ncbi:MAG: CvpA family protein [Planctomycetes bacterium]|nr:CvpA family protein [Planctomycetota bacterium]